MKTAAIVTFIMFIVSCAWGQVWTEHSNGLIPPDMDGGNTELEFYDINLDGYIDILCIGDHGSPYINTDQHGIMVWFGDGAGNWSVYQNGNFGYGGIAVGDVNNDGFPDVGYGMHHDYSSTDFGDQLIEVALGDGTGMNWIPWDDGLATTGEDWGMFGTDFADIDADGDLDLVSASFGYGAGMRIYRNEGDGTWSYVHGTSQRNSNLYAEFGDINGDGYPDAVVCIQDVAVFMNDGTGNFYQLTGGGLPAPGNIGYYDVALGDVDNDGKDEVGIVNSGVMEIWKLNTDGQTWTDMSHELRNYPSKQAIDIADMNSDGLLDVVGHGSGNCHILFGDGGSSWSLVYSFTTPSPGYNQALRAGADVDNNGYGDIVLVNEKQISLFTYRNYCMFFMETSSPDSTRIVPIYPRGHETIIGGSAGWIEWMTEIVGAQPANVKIELSTDGYNGPYSLLADSLPNNGRHQLVWPWYVLSDSCHIKLTLTGQDTVTAVTPAAFSILGQQVSIEDETTVPDKAFLVRQYPNPFNATTTIEFLLIEREFVKIEIFDLRGRRIEILLSQVRQPGTHRIIWDATGYASGIYYYRIQAGENSRTKRMMYLK